MIVYFLNIADLISTLWGLENGAVEMNPVINFFLGIHPLLFPFVKIVPAFFLCQWLEQNAKKNPAARKRLNVISAVYAAVVANNFVVLFIMK